MSDAADEARTRLWEWLSEADDPDDEQRAWKRTRVEGMLLACRCTALLPASEIDGLQALVAGGAIGSAPNADLAAAERHLEALLGDVGPLSRDADPARLHAGRRYLGALEALHGAGVLDDAAHADWHARELAASAPWLKPDDVAEIASASGLVYAIGVPPCTPEEEAADAAAEHELELLMRRGEIRRVLSSRTADRHDGLAVIAIVARSEATEVIFHHVGPPHGPTLSGRAGLAAFEAVTEALSPPALIDDAGTSYEPLGSRPVASHGTGGMPDPDRPQVISGVWRYQPAAPPAVRRFTVTVDDAQWVFT